MIVLAALPAEVCAEKTKVIELKLAHHNGPTAPISVNGFNVYAKMIEKATDQRVKVTVYPAQTLVKGAETYEAVTGGITDIGWAFHGFFPNRFPLSSVVWIPGMGIPSSVVGGKVLMDLYYKFPEIQAEYPGVKMLFIHCHTPAGIGTSKKRVRVPADLKGLKMRISGAMPTAFMKAHGVTPVSMGPGNMYPNMQKGVINGYCIDWEGIDNFKMYEVTKYWCQSSWYTGLFFCVMNLDKWNSLPPDIQKAIDSVSGYNGAYVIDKSQDDAEDPVRKKCAEYGIEVIDPTPEEMAQWQAAGDSFKAKWIAEMEAKGLPGQKVFDECVRLIQKYSK
jgi:TRAP-type C4-dicarboxylate transport system substrate-binding protein